MVRGSCHCTGGSDQNHPPKKKFKKAQSFSEEALQIVEEKYTHLNSQFQRRARSDKKDVLSDHCKEIEEN